MNKKYLLIGAAVVIGYYLYTNYLSTSTAST